MSDPAGREDPVLVLAPTGRDTSLIGELLRREGLPWAACRAVEDLTARAKSGAASIIVAEEALVGRNLAPFISVLNEQEPWSDLPLILLTGSGAQESDTSSHLLSVFGQEANVTLLERPVRATTLLSSVRAALRARRRQYEVREHLAERRRSDELLLQTQKLESLGVLAGGVAHDFNNLLTGIMGNASLASDELPPELDHLRAILAEVVSASESASNLTKQLLAYAGKARFVVAPLEMSSTVKSIGHLVQSSIPSNVTLTLDLGVNLPRVDADKSQVQQIIMNLVINAAEAIPAKRAGTVLVRTYEHQVDDAFMRKHFQGADIPAGRYIALEIRDDGIGMDDDTRARIFDPFFTTKFLGRGLGLAAVLGIVRGHKGALTVESAPGQGSTFRILFPATDKPVPVTSEALSSNGLATVEKTTVLVIDDEVTVRRTAKAALERQGYTVILAEDGPEGIEVFRALNRRISAVLLDFTMPRLNGAAVFAELQAIRRDVPVILSSGFDQLEMDRVFVNKDLAGFIQKPYTATALVRKIADVLADRS